MPAPPGCIGRTSGSIPDSGSDSDAMTSVAASGRPEGATIEAAMRDDDVMMITADHGNDPTFRGSDHTREYAPLLVYGKTARAGVNLGTRESLADIGQTIADNFGIRLTAGSSFLERLK